MEEKEQTFNQQEEHKERKIKSCSNLLGKCFMNIKQFSYKSENYRPISSLGKRKILKDEPLDEGDLID